MSVSPWPRRRSFSRSCHRSSLHWSSANSSPEGCWSGSDGNLGATEMIEREQGGRLRYGRQFRDRARRVRPGGVNINVKMDERPQPLYFVRAEGSRLVDCDGNSYIDYTCGFGPVILGHAYPSVVHAMQQAAAQGLLYGGQHEAEVQLAELLRDLVPCIEVVRLSCKGSEAVAPAIRLARAYTGRTKVIRFAGHYHGWFDELLISTHPPADEAESVPLLESAGQPASAAAEVLVTRWNDLAALERLVAAHSGEVHAGTFNGNPVGVAAALATLRELSSRANEIYAHLTALGTRLMHGIRQIAAAKNIPVLLQGPGAVFYMWFTPAPAVHDYATSARIDRAPYARFAEAMLAAGVRLIPGGRWYVSFSHTDADVSRTLDAVAGALDEAVR